MLEELRSLVCRANQDIVDAGLVTLTFGNVSGIDRGQGLVAIKPSGVAYQDLTPEAMVIIDLDGKVVEGSNLPSTDTPTHLLLYRRWKKIGGVTHTHGAMATMFAQAMTPIPCLGTTHADYFRGGVPVTRPLTGKETENDYEKNTGAVIVERFEKLDPLEMPAVLVASHGPFTWGHDPQEAVTNAVALEQVARLAFGTIRINPDAAPIQQHLLDKHFTRKHGPGAYYGQKKN